MIPTQSICVLTNQFATRTRRRHSCHVIVVNNAIVSKPMEYNVAVETGKFIVRMGIVPFVMLKKVEEN